MKENPAPLNGRLYHVHLCNFLNSSEPLSWPKSSRRLSYKISNSIDLVVIAYVVCAMASLRLVSPKEYWEKIQAGGRTTQNTMNFLNPHFLWPLLQSQQKVLVASIYLWMHLNIFIIYVYIRLRAGISGTMVYMRGQSITFYRPTMFWGMISPVVCHYIVNSRLAGSCASAWFLLSDSHLAGIISSIILYKFYFFV